MYSISNFLKYLNERNYDKLKEYGKIENESMYKTVFVPYNKKYVIKEDIDELYSSCEEEIRLYNISKKYGVENIFLPNYNIGIVKLPIDKINYDSITKNFVKVNFSLYITDTTYYLQEKIEEINEIEDYEDSIESLLTYLTEKYDYITSLKEMWYSNYLIIKLIELYEPNGIRDIEEYCRLEGVEIEELVDRDSSSKNKRKKSREENRSSSIEKINSENSIINNNNSNNSKIKSNSSNSGNNSSSSGSKSSSSSIKITLNTLNPIISFLIENSVMDVHCANWGWLRGNPVIFDYSADRGIER